MKPMSRLVLVSLLLLGATANARPTNFTVRDLDGKYVRLSDFSKKVLVMSFWATWCTPCIQELRHLQKFYDKYKHKGLVVLAVSLDQPETRAKVQPTVRRYRFTFPVVVDAEGQIVRLYNAKRVNPYTVLMKHGKVIRTREAFQVSDLPAIEKEILGALR